MNTFAMEFVSRSRVFNYLPKEDSMFGKLSRLNEAVTEWSWKAVFWGSDLRRRVREERGQTTLEYLVIILIMVGLLITIAMFISPKLRAMVTNLIDRIESAISNVST
jgi:hypothetical protein